MRNWAIFVILFSLCVPVGCASDVANRYYKQERYTPKPVEQVDLLFSKPDRSFEVIADFQSRGESPEDYREKAARIGADAVIVTHLGGFYATDEQWAGTDRYKDRYHSHIIGTAIRYIGSDQR